MRASSSEQCARTTNPLSHPCGRFYRGRMSGNGEIVRDVLAKRWEALEGPPLLLMETPVEDGGLELLIYDEHSALVDVSYVPAELVDVPTRIAAS